MNIDKIKIDPRMPKHIGLIIDGNGRWAKKRGYVRSVGHKYGFDNLKTHIDFVRELGINTVSLYCFSAENWNRPQEEVDYLMDTFCQVLDEFEQKYLSQDVKINISGNMDDERVPIHAREQAKKLINLTKDKTGFIINLCINYGGRQEILKAVNEIIANGEQDIDQKKFEKHLYTADLLPLDFVIRTSGEQRASNFMTWQSVYSEWIYPKKYWPAFTKKDLIKALKNYMKRNRRFGAIKG